MTVNPLRVVGLLPADRMVTQFDRVANDRSAEVISARQDRKDTL